MAGWGSLVTSTPARTAPRASSASTALVSMPAQLRTARWRSTSGPATRRAGKRSPKKRTRRPRSGSTRRRPPRSAPPVRADACGVAGGTARRHADDGAVQESRPRRAAADNGARDPEETSRGSGHHRCSSPAELRVVRARTQYGSGRPDGVRRSRGRGRDGGCGRRTILMRPTATTSTRITGRMPVEPLLHAALPGPTGMRSTGVVHGRGGCPGGERGGAVFPTRRGQHAHALAILPP